MGGNQRTNTYTIQRPDGSWLRLELQGDAHCGVAAITSSRGQQPIGAWAIYASVRDMDALVAAWLRWRPMTASVASVAVGVTAKGIVADGPDVRGVAARRRSPATGASAGTVDDASPAPNGPARHHGDAGGG